MVSYEELGVRRVINAAATLTRLGGSRMPAPAIAAMAEGASAFVDLDELQRKVSERIATLTRNEACYVSSGAAAGITIAAAACITGGDPALVARLPYIGDVDCKNEIIIHRAHRNGYDHAARQTGAKLVEIGMAHTTQTWELEEAITPRTACVLYFAGAHYARGALKLPQVIEIAHRHDVPVLVDAAAQIPPISNLWHYTTELGADIAIFSGGKGLQGPQSSGLILGRREIIQHCAINGSPNHSIGRPMKVGKEEQLGLLAAVGWSLEQNEEERLARYEETVQRWLSELAGIPGVTPERGFPSEAGQPHARATLRFASTFPLQRDEVVKELYDQNPRIAVGVVDDDAIALNPQSLEPGDDLLVLRGVEEVLTQERAKATSQ